MGLQQLPGVHPEGRVLAVGEHAGRGQGGGEDVESEGEGADVLRLGFLNFDFGLLLHNVELRQVQVSPPPPCDY